MPRRRWSSATTAVLLNTAVAQGRRSGRDGARLRAGDRSGPRRLPRRTDAAARHGRALDAGRRQSRADMSALASLTPSPSPSGRGELGLDPFYPIVDSAAWVARLVGVGARLIQLRIKDKDEALDRARDARGAGDSARKLARPSSSTTIGASRSTRAPLGPSRPGRSRRRRHRRDPEGGLQARRQHPRRCRARARAQRSIPTTSRSARSIRRFSRPWPSRRRACERIGEWKRRIGAIPLVAIGGLNVERAKLCLAAGADIVSVVTDITLNADPEARAREWIAATRPA